MSPQTSSFIYWRGKMGHLQPFVFLGIERSPVLVSTAGIGLWFCPPRFSAAHRSKRWLHWEKSMGPVSGRSPAFGNSVLPYNWPCIWAKRRFHGVLPACCPNRGSHPPTPTTPRQNQPRSARLGDNQHPSPGLTRLSGSTTAPAVTAKPKQHRTPENPTRGGLWAIIASSVRSIPWEQKGLCFGGRYPFRL